MKRSNLNNVTKKQRIILTAAIIVGALAVSYFLSKHLRVSITNSLRYRFFLTLNRSKMFKTGDYVVFVHDVPGTQYRNVNMIKKVGCDEGDVFFVNDKRELYCNGEYLGAAKAKLISLPNQKHFEWNGLVPKGKFLPMGENKDSFDGRYYGFVEKSLVDAKAIPLF